MNDQPTGYILYDGDLMGFWLPEDVNADELEIDWIAP